MKNKIIIIVSLIYVVGTIGIIYFKQEKNNQHIEKNETKVPKYNYDIVETMKRIDVTNTLEELNEIIGFEGEQSLYNEDDYKWKFDNNNMITLKNASDTPLIEAHINKNTIKNDNIKFPSNEELKEMIKNGITYDELVKQLGGIDGVLNSKDKLSVGYIWVDKNRQTLTATFYKETQKCLVAVYSYK